MNMAPLVIENSYAFHIENHAIFIWLGAGFCIGICILKTH
jgi:hypothetical protein